MTKDDLRVVIKQSLLDFESSSKIPLTHEHRLCFVIGYIEGIRDQKKIGSFEGITDSDLLELLLETIKDTVFMK